MSDYQNYGYVLTPRGQVRPFFEYRKIQKGKNKGSLEITLPSGYARSKVHPKSVIVKPDAVRRFPWSKPGF